MTWKTPVVRRLNKLRLINGTLRRYGLPQPAPGLSHLGDSAKVALHDAARLAMEPLRRSRDSAPRLARPDLWQRRQLLLSWFVK